MFARVTQIGNGNGNLNKGFIKSILCEVDWTFSVPHVKRDWCLIDSHCRNIPASDSGLKK